MANTKGKATDAFNVPKHTGRPIDVEKLPPKDLVKVLGRYEFARSLGECGKAGAMDVLIDLAQDAVEAFVPMGFKTVVKAPLEIMEMVFEHGAEEVQGVEHKENMKLMIEATLKMYRDQAVKPNQDKKKIGKTINKLEWMLAWNTGDIRVVKKYEKVWGPVAKGMNATMKMVNGKIFDGIKHVVLEILDFAPLVCPESAMEVYRMSRLKVLADIYNKHPDITSKDQKLKIDMRSIMEAFEIQALRVKALLQGNKKPAAGAA